MPYATPKSRWTALLTRDPLAANAFVYCVTTTKIYCRPNCPSRLARRANVEFHDSPADARAAGYRACMRCKPELSGDASDPQRIAIAKTCASIAAEARGAQKKGVRELARDAGFTESHFCRVFKKGTGMTVGEYRASIAGKPDAGEEVPEGLSAVAESPYEFDFGAVSLDARDQAQLDFELASGWFDFSRMPDTSDEFGLGADNVLQGGLFDEAYSNSNTGSSLATSPGLWPEAVDEDLLGLEQFTFVT